MIVMVGNKPHKFSRGDSSTAPPKSFETEKQEVMRQLQGIYLLLL